MSMFYDESIDPPDYADLPAANEEIVRLRRELFKERSLWVARFSKQERCLSALRKIVEVCDKGVPITFIKDISEAVGKAKEELGRLPQVTP